MKKVTKLMIAVVALMALGTACSKYPGFKKDKSGLYYKFYVENKDAAQPQMNECVDATYSFRIQDSVLVENAPLRMIIESLYLGDIFDAFKLMHLGDSATFIMNGDTFYHDFMGQPFPFEKKELYIDLKLNNIIPKEELEKQQAAQMRQYEAMIEEFRLSEDSLINNYIKTHKITVKPTASGLYFIKTVSGKGNPVIKGSKIKVDYTGKQLDGTVFDSSVERGEPFDLVVGQGSVIPGWEEALLLMKEGDRATVIIPSKLAYGSRGAGYSILPYTPLLFDMEIVEVE
jgi:FKBP-type peptidyl-prolyl cis-trans isomerase